MASMGNAQRGALGGLAKLGEGARTTSNLSRVGGGLSRGANEGKKLNAAPWSDTWPAAGATLDLDFANNRGFVRGVGQGGVMDAITFTRASTGWYVGEDGLLQEADNGEPRFDWASTEQVANRNLLTFTEQFDNAPWIKLNTTINSVAITNPFGDSTAYQAVAETSVSNANHRVSQISTSTSSSIYTFSFYAKANELTFVNCFIRNGTSTSGDIVEASFDLSTGSSTVAGMLLNQTWSNPVASIEEFPVGSGWYRCSLTAESSTISTKTGMICLSNASSFTSNPAFAGNNVDSIYIWGAQLEIGSTATEYQPIAQPTTNTSLRANPTSNGILIEEARTNRLLWNRDATQTEWVKTNITAVKDQTGIEGVANAASSLTATDDNGTCIQTITLGAGNRTGSVYLKRLTGTGNIQVTLDGSTYSTVELSDTEWYRIVLSGSVTNPTVGIKIAVDGDAVAMDYGQVEDGLFATSPILTTTATATRAIELGVVFIDKFGANSGGYNQATLIGKFTPVYSGATPFGNFCGVSMRDSVGNGNLNNMIIQNVGNGNVQFITTGGGVSAPVSALSSPSGTLSMGVSFKGGVRSFAAKGTQGTFSRTDTYAGSAILLNSANLSNQNSTVSVTMTVNRLIFISKYNTNGAIEQIVNTL
jgi:hypothetical protein